ncbi:MAG: nucleoside/nucleotide kinase family protein, partial [Marmoricola sp.]
VALLARLRAETTHTVWAPAFDRAKELSVAGAIGVRPEHRLVVTEGNYLLFEGGGWAAVRPLLDEVWFVEQEESTRVERLVQRHVAHGKPVELARRWTLASDQANADLVAQTRAVADLVVTVG